MPLGEVKLPDKKIKINKGKAQKFIKPEEKKAEEAPKKRKGGLSAKSTYELGRPSKALQAKARERRDARAAAAAAAEAPKRKTSSAGRGAYSRTQVPRTMQRRAAEKRAAESKPQVHGAVSGRVFLGANLARKPGPMPAPTIAHPDGSGRRASNPEYAKWKTDARKFNAARQESHAIQTVGQHKPGAFNAPEQINVPGKKNVKRLQGYATSSKTAVNRSHGEAKKIENLISANIAEKKPKAPAAPAAPASAPAATLKPVGKPKVAGKMARARLAGRR
jgi:hypothetical protein